MHLIQRLIAFIGRFFLSLIFISSGFHQIMNWPDTRQILTNVLNDWTFITLNTPFFHSLFSESLSSVTLLLAGAIFCQVIGGLSILLGIRVRLGAFLLILFIVPVTVLFHHFWLMQDPDRQTEMIEFMKNASILGGLLLLLAYGNCQQSKKHDSAEPSKR